MVDIKAACYFWKWQNKKLPGFKRGLEMPTNKVKVVTRTKHKTTNATTFYDSVPMKNYFLNQVVPMWDNLPLNTTQGKFFNLTAKTIKEPFLAFFKKTTKHIQGKNDMIGR